MPIEKINPVEQKTKSITFNLWAYTRVESTVTKEVPVETTEEELSAMLTKLKGETCGTEYQDDPDYWEEGDGSWEIAEEEE